MSIKEMGALLCRLRGDRPRTEIAEALDVNVSTVWRWEAGESMPGRLEAVLDAYGASDDDADEARAIAIDLLLGGAS